MLNQPTPARLPIHRSGTQEVLAHALLDPPDYERLCGNKWVLSPFGYCVRSYGNLTLYLQREVLELPSRKVNPIMADHINRDKLDNRRANLRLVDAKGNGENRTCNKGSKSRFRGVSWVSKTKRWRATGYAGRVLSLGDFTDEVHAARVAEVWRTENMPHAQPDPELAKLDI